MVNMNGAQVSVPGEPFTHGTRGNSEMRHLRKQVQLTDLEVRIPRLQVVTLERLAAIDGETVSAVLARELRDLVSVHAPWLSAEVPGFGRRSRGLAESGTA
jgi:hypothetical protein